MNRILAAVALLAISANATARASAQSAISSRPIAGVWVLNRELSPAPPSAQDEDVPHIPDPPADGRRGGFSPQGGRFGDGSSRRGPSAAAVRKARIARDRLLDIVDRFSLAIDGATVTIVDGIGRITTLRADGKKQDRLSGDGKFTSRTRFDGEGLIVEDDFGGPRIITTYERVPDPVAHRLQVTVRIEALPRYRFGQPDGRQEIAPRVSVYDADRTLEKEPR